MNHSHGAVPTDLERRVSECVAAIAARLNTQLVEVTLDLRVVLAGEISELDGDQRIIELLGASIEGNVATILHMLAHDIPAEHVEPPSAAFEYARRLAQRGVPVNALVRAYRLGQDRLLKWTFAEIERRSGDTTVAFLVMRRMVTDTFAYVDWISQQVVVVYEQERERWLANRNTVRAGRIRELLDGDDLADADPAGDVDALEATLGYGLRQRHLGVIVWSAEGSRDDDLQGLERFAATLADHLGCRSRPLFVAYDRSTCWAWLPVSGAPALDPAVIARLVRDGGHPVRVAYGDPAAGVAGFRATHRQALRAQSVALVAGPHAGQVTAFAEVGAVSLLCADLDAARSWVADTLGGLAADDEPRARLRETLRVFLAGGSSYTTAADRLTMHKNSVKYRVARALQERGRPLGDDRLDVELALMACRWLGRAVLATPR
nr:helix-turn-helix domain-containing protein [Pseudonocardia acidicola]